MATATVLITDLHAPERVAHVDAGNVAGIVGGWLSADGLAHGASATVRSLARALEAGDWTAVHGYADDLSVGLTVLETAEEAQTSAELAADIWTADWMADEPDAMAVAGLGYALARQLADASEIAADMADGWGLLGGLQ